MKLKSQKLEVLLRKQKAKVVCKKFTTLKEVKLL